MRGVSVWLSPVQAVVLPITDRQHEYAQKVLKRLKDANIRAELDGSSHTLNYRIRHHQSQKVPYLLIVGEREAASEHVAVRLRTGQDLGPQPSRRSSRGSKIASPRDRLSFEPYRRVS
jgi:threonyl-tRNA synthetase